VPKLFIEAADDPELARPYAEIVQERARTERAGLRFCTGILLDMERRRQARLRESRGELFLLRLPATGRVMPLIPGPFAENGGRKHEIPLANVTARL